MYTNAAGSGLRSFSALLYHVHSVFQGFLGSRLCSSKCTSRRMLVAGGCIWLHVLRPFILFFKAALPANALLTVKILSRFGK
jgi:hypothetical protein